MELAYRLLNVFTLPGDRLSGNPLCVFEDGRGLEPARMQALARQFNLSETTFVLPPEQAGATVRVRIFTPDFEMPFAGHPTLGTAHVVRALSGAGDRVTLGMTSGLVEVRAEGDRWTLRAPRAPATRVPRTSPDDLAAMVGLPPGSVTRPLWVDTGVEQLMLPVRTAAEVRAARPVRARRVSEAEYGSLPVRSRGLPEGFEGDIHLVEIEGLDLNTCGGTHVRSTAELEAVALLGTEPMRGGTRLHFVAGGRLRRRLAGHEARNAAIKAVLDAPEGEFVTLVQRRKDELRDAERRLRALAEELAGAAAEALAGRPGNLVDAHFDGRDPAFLGTLARRLATLAPAKLAFLTATNEAGSFFVLTGGEQVTADVQALGRQVAESLGGRGGGSAQLFQGKAASLAARSAALATLRRLS